MLAIVLLCPYLIYAQPAWTWAIGAQSGSDQRGAAIVADENGNNFSTGYFKGSVTFGSTTLTSSGGEDMYLVKYTTGGTAVWATAIAGSGNEDGYGVAIDAAGNIYVCGAIDNTVTCNGSPNITVPTYGGRDIFVAKYNAAGQVLWAKHAGSNNNDEAFAICTNGNSVYITGDFEGTATFGALPALTSGGGADVFIAAYDCSSGTEQWAVKGGTTAGDCGEGIAVDASGVYVSGYYGNATCTFQNHTGSLTSNGNTDVFLVKYNLTGTTGIWKRRAGSNGQDEGTCVTLNGNFVYVGGFFQNTISFYNTTTAVATLATAGAHDSFIAQFDATSGNYSWVRSESGSGDDRIFGIDAGPNGIVYTTGYWNGTLPFGSGPSVTSNGRDVFVTTYSSAGTFLYGLRATGSSEEEGAGVSGNSNNEVFVTGYYKSSNTQFGSTPQLNNSSDDIFIAKFVCGTTTANAGADQTICAATSTMSGNTPSAGAGTWTLVSGTGTFVNANQPNTTVNSLSVGPNVFRWTISNGGCESFDEVTITRDALPTTSNAGSNQTLCSSTSTLSGNTPTIGTGVWSLISGSGTPTSPSAPNSPVTGLTAGTNIFQWTITNGACPSSTDQVNIVVDPFPTTANAGADQTVCSSTATLAGNTPTTGTGAWSVIAGGATVTTPSSPTSGVTGLSVGVNRFVWRIQNGTCPVSRDTMIITRDATPTTANAGTNQTLCSSSSTLSGNTPTIGTGVWSLISGSGTPTSPSTPNSAVSGLAVGTNIFQWTITNGTCPSSTDQVNIVVDPFPTTANAGTDQTVCSSTATLAGNTPTTGTGAWSVIAGAATVTTPSSPTSGVTGLSVGVNRFVWRIQNGTCPVSRDTMIITRDATPTTANAGSNQTLCSSTTTLSGNTPTIGTGVWSLISGNGTPTSPSAPNSAVTGLAVGTNIFQWTITNGTCPSSIDQVNIVVDPFPTTANAGADQTVCSSTATLAGNTPTTGTGSWSVIAGGATVTTPSSPTSGVTGLSVGTNTFVWRIQNGTCPSSRDTVIIQRDALPSTAYAGFSQTLCSSSAFLNAINPTTGNGLWTLVSGSGTFVNPSSDNTTVNGLSVGPNVFQWTVTNGVCPSSSDQVTVTVDAMPTTSNAGSDQTICSSTAVLSGNTPVTGNGTWSEIVGNGNVTTPSSPNSGVSNLATGQNMFVWTIANGTCPSSRDTVLIQRDALPSTAFAGSNQTLCSASAFLNAVNPSIGTGMWSVVSGNGTFVNPNSDNTTVNGLDTGANVFQWTVTNGVCPASTDIVTINVDALPTPASAGADQTICASTFTLNGNAPVIGSGTWTVLNGNGTVASPTSENSGVNNLSVGQNMLSWSVSNGTCPVSHDTVIIQRDAMPSTASAGSDQTLCSSSAFINGNNPQTGNGLWTLVSGNGTIANPNSDNTSVSNLDPGANIFQWTISNGVCPSSVDSVTITVDEMPTTANAGSDDVLCSSTHQLSGNTPLVGTGAWSVLLGGGTFANPSLPTTSVTGLPIGINILQWTISNGVCPSSSDNVLITIDLSPTTALAGLDHARCATDDTLDGNIPLSGTGVWSLLSGSGTIQNPSAANSPVTALGVGVNEFTWTISNGVCPASVDTVVITRDDFPSQAVAGADANSCSPTDTLNASVPLTGSGTWSIIGGNSTLNDPLLSNSAADNLSTGQNIFVWTVSNGVCPATHDTVVITYNEFPSAPFAGADLNSCSEPVTMQAQFPVIGNGVWASVSGSPLVADSTNPQMQLPVLAPGTWYYTWTTQNGFCIAAPDTVAITVYAIPDSAVAGDDRITYVRSLQLNALPLDTGTGTWTFVQGSGTFDDIHNPSTRVNDLAVGVNILRWTASNGTCPENTDDLRIQVLELVVPQGFSPNGDGVNDQFEITGLDEFENPSLVVFNRWGSEVYTSAAYHNDWNGTGVNGEQLPDDAYYYVLKVDSETVFTGYIMIKRSTP